jgi:hypothetical protein
MRGFILAQRTDEPTPRELSQLTFQRPEDPVPYPYYTDKLDLEPEIGSGAPPGRLCPDDEVFG